MVMASFNLPCRPRSHALRSARFIATCASAIRPHPPRIDSACSYRPRMPKAPARAILRSFRCRGWPRWHADPARPPYPTRCSIAPIAWQPKNWQPLACSRQEQPEPPPIAGRPATAHSQPDGRSPGGIHRDRQPAKQPRRGAHSAALASLATASLPLGPGVPARPRLRRECRRPMRRKEEKPELSFQARRSPDRAAWRSPA